MVEVGGTDAAGPRAGSTTAVDSGATGDGAPAAGDAAESTVDIGVDVGFATVRRGYDRDQVDAAVRELHAQLTAARARAAAAEVRSGAAAGGDAGTPERAGPGRRMEKLLRAAEEEAKEIRAQATREVAAVLARARADAEQEQDEHRARWAQREAAIADAERAMAAAAAEAQQQVRALLEVAERDAQHIRREAHDWAEQTRLYAEHTAAQRTEQARAAVERLVGVQAEVRADLERLMRTLSGVRDALAYELRAGAPAGEEVTAPVSGRGGNMPRFRPAGLARPGPGWTPSPGQRAESPSPDQGGGGPDPQSP
ncbi:MAG TPA: hypothetical protein VGE11_10905 [Pseudonocardia sp.]